MVDPRFLVLDDTIAAKIQRAIDKTFSASFQIETHVDAWNVGRSIDLDLHARHAAKIAMTDRGIPFGSFIAAFNRPLLLKILNLGVDPVDPILIDDAAGEITNMLFGLFKADVNGEGYGLSMGLPVLLHENENVEADWASHEKMCLNYSAGNEHCWVAIAQYH